MRERYGPGDSRSIRRMRSTRTHDDHMADRRAVIQPRPPAVRGRPVVPALRETGAGVEHAGEQHLSVRWRAVRIRARSLRSGRELHGAIVWINHWVMMRNEFEDGGCKDLIPLVEGHVQVEPSSSSAA
jgi:hypothetical protein